MSLDFESPDAPRPPQSSLDVTPRMALEDCLRQVTFAENPPSKALLIFLWDDDNKFDTSSANAGLRSSEILALCEVVKAKTLAAMQGRAS